MLENSQAWMGASTSSSALAGQLGQFDLLLIFLMFVLCLSVCYLSILDY